MFNSDPKSIFVLFTQKFSLLVHEGQLFRMSVTRATLTADICKVSSATLNQLNISYGLNPRGSDGAY